MALTTIPSGMISSVSASTLSGQLPDANIASLAATKLTGQVPDANAPSGSVVQVVQTVKTDTYGDSTGSWVDITGMSASITPSSASNKVLVLVSIKGGGDASPSYNTLRLVRGGSVIADGAGAASRSCGFDGFNPRDGNDTYNAVLEFLDSPSSTSSVTYKVQVTTAVSGRAFYVNRSAGDGDGATSRRMISSITLMEIAA